MKIYQEREGVRKAKWGRNDEEIENGTKEVGYEVLFGITIRKFVNRKEAGEKKCIAVRWGEGDGSVVMTVGKGA